MNFIEAHMIVHGYGHALTLESSKNALLYRPISYLKNTKDEIIDAYKLFYGHMIFFQTRTQEEYEQYEGSRKMLNYFIDDATYHDIIRCNEILAKGSFGKLLNKSRFEDAQKRKNYYLNKLSIIIESGPYRNEEIEESFIEMQETALKMQRSITKETPFETILDIINAYCEAVYDISMIPMNEYDIDYFYPFGLLRDFCKNPSLSDLFSRYASYIKNAN